jgi:hypothetical protein
LVASVEAEPADVNGSDLEMALRVLSLPGYFSISVSLSDILLLESQPFITTAPITHFCLSVHYKSNILLTSL